MTSILKCVFLIQLQSFSGIKADPLVCESPTWSPTRNEIAFTSNRLGQKDIFIFDLDVGKSRRITESEADDTHPSWSSDGQKLLFVSERDGNKEVYQVSRNGEDEKRITRTPGNEFAPSWMSATEILVSYIDPQPDSLSKTSHSFSLSGQHLGEVGAKTRFNIYPRIDKTQNLLALTSRPRSGGSNQIAVMNLTTNSINQLTDMDIACYNASWSPDGKKLIFVNQAGSDIATASLYIYDFEKKDLHKIQSCDHGCFQPSFSSDGQRIIFRHGWIESYQGIFIKSLSGQAEEIKFF